jgi:hypothetical protein
MMPLDHCQLPSSCYLNLLQQGLPACCHAYQPTPRMQYHKIPEYTKYVHKQKCKQLFKNQGFHNGQDFAQYKVLKFTHVHWLY